jgi:hypothetical protein
MYSVRIPGRHEFEINCRSLSSAVARRIGRLLGYTSRGRWSFVGGSQVGNNLYQGMIIRSDRIGHHVVSAVLWERPQAR